MFELRPGLDSGLGLGLVRLGLVWFGLVCFRSVVASFCVFICIILVSLTRLRVLRFCACQEARRAQTVAGAGDGNGNGKEK